MTKYNTKTVKVKPGKGTAYRVMITQITQPEENDVLGRIGYAGTSYIFTDMEIMKTQRDPYRFSLDGLKKFAIEIRDGDIEFNELTDGQEVTV